MLSESTGLGIVPPTVLRSDAPLGEGSLQWFVNADFGEHYFSLYAERPDLHDQLRAIAVFDVIANNTDRKSGHCLLEIDSAGGGDHVWAIDNGLCFAADDKLRTVIWEFAGDRLPEQLRRVATKAVDAPAELAGLLDDDEVAAVSTRARRLATDGEVPRRAPRPRLPVAAGVSERRLAGRRGGAGRSPGSARVSGESDEAASSTPWSSGPTSTPSSGSSTTAPQHATGGDCEQLVTRAARPSPPGASCGRWQPSPSTASPSWRRRIAPRR